VAGPALPARNCQSVSEPVVGGIVSATENGVVDPQEAMPGLSVPHTCAVARSYLRLLHLDGVAVAVRAGPDTAQLIHATDPVITELDNLQLTLGEGPCVDAYRQGAPVLVPDLWHPAVSDRWPGFAREATRAGAAAAFAFPLRIGAVPFGTVELYRAAPGALTGPGTAVALFITEDLTRTVLDELAGTGQLEPTASNPEPQFGRVEIPQATGMIAVQLHIGIPQALAQLRAAAFTANLTVLHLARDVIAGRISFATDPSVRGSETDPT
jgi:hypothetical protein